MLRLSAEETEGERERARERERLGQSERERYGGGERVIGRECGERGRGERKGLR